MLTITVVKASLYLAAFLFVAAPGASDEFSLHPAAHRLAHTPAAPIVSSGKARRYRSVLRAEAREGANFNGHYRVASWGCGTNCIEWAVIDLESGKVWFPPEPAYSCWAPEQSDDKDVPDWFAMRTTSSLLYLHICDPPLRGSRTFTTRRVYVWTGSELTMLRSEAIGNGGSENGVGRLFEQIAEALDLRLWLPQNECETLVARSETLIVDDKRSTIEGNRESLDVDSVSTCSRSEREGPVVSPAHPSVRYWWSIGSVPSGVVLFKGPTPWRPGWAGMLMRAVPTLFA